MMYEKKILDIIWDMYLRFFFLLPTKMDYSVIYYKELRLEILQEKKFEYEKKFNTTN